MLCRLLPNSIKPDSGVVVRYRQMGNSLHASFPHQLQKRIRPIRKRCMCMQVGAEFPTGLHPQQIPQRLLPKCLRGTLFDALPFAHCTISPFCMLNS